MSETPRRGQKSSSMPGPLERVFNDQIEPLLEQVYALCDAHGIDYLAAFVTDDHGESYHIAGRCHVEREGLMTLHVAAELLSGNAKVGVLDGEPPDETPVGRA